VLPVKHNEISERDVDTRLGIVHQSSFPVTPPSPLPSPLELEGAIVPEPSHTEEPPVAPAKDSDGEESSHYVNAKEFSKYVKGKKAHKYERVDVVNNNALTSTTSAGSVLPSSTDSESLTVSVSESVNQAEEPQIRGKFKFQSSETSRLKDNRTSQFANAVRVSQFVAAAQEAAKFEKPAPIQKPGQLVVSKALEKKLANVLVRHQTLRAVQQTDDQPDVGIDVGASEMPSAVGRPSVTSSDSKKSARLYNAGLDVPEESRGIILLRKFQFSCCNALYCLLIITGI